MGQLPRKIALLLLLLVPFPVFGQNALYDWTGTTASYARNYTSLPSICFPGQIFVSTSVAPGFYYCNGSSAWVNVSGGGATTPGGSSTQIQFNMLGAFDGSPNFTWDDTIGRLSVNGAAAFKHTSTATSYTVLASDYLIGVTNTSAARTVTLPASTSVLTGQAFTIVDESNGAGTNNITVQRGASDTFLGGGTSVIIDVDGGSVTVFWTGSVWAIK